MPTKELLKDKSSSLQYESFECKQLTPCLWTHDQVCEHLLPYKLYKTMTGATTAAYRIPLENDTAASGSFKLKNALVICSTNPTTHLRFCMDPLANHPSALSSSPGTSRVNPLQARLASNQTWHLHFKQLYLSPSSTQTPESNCFNLAKTPKNSQVDLRVAWGLKRVLWRASGEKYLCCLTAAPAQRLLQWKRGRLPRGTQTRRRERKPWRLL